MSKKSKAYTKNIDCLSEMLTKTQAERDKAQKAVERLQGLWDLDRTARDTFKRQRDEATAEVERLRKRSPVLPECIKYWRSQVNRGVWGDWWIKVAKVTSADAADCLEYLINA